MRVLVTGGSGLVGSALKNIVESKQPTKTEAGLQGSTWIFVSSKDADLRNWEQTRRLFEEQRPTHVIHLAGYVGGLFKNMRDPVQFFEYNTAINTNVLRASHH